MAHYLVDGIVLRTYKLGESDRILHILDPNRGKVRGVAKGIRKPGSRFGGRLEPYSHVSVQMYEGRSLDIVDQAELIAPHSEVREDWELAACAATMAETCDKLAQENERATSLFLLLKDALAVLAAGPSRPVMVLDAFLFRVATVSGNRPALNRCVTCGTTERLTVFHIASGGTLCSRHAPTGAQHIDSVTLETLRLLAEGTWRDVAQGDGPTPRRAGVLVRSYLTYHLVPNLNAWEAVPR